MALATSTVLPRINRMTNFSTNNTGINMINLKSKPHHYPKDYTLTSHQPTSCFSFLSLLYTPQPGPPGQETLPAKKIPTTTLYVKIMDPPIFVGEMFRLKLWYQKKTPESLNNIFIYSMRNKSFEKELQDAEQNGT